jgi:hypothetical protein
MSGGKNTNPGYSPTHFHTASVELRPSQTGHEQPVEYFPQSGRSRIEFHDSGGAAKATSVNAFELDVLGRLFYDYEAVHTIRGDMERDLGRTVLSSEVEAALFHLVEDGFAEAYRYDPHGARYRKVSLVASSVTDSWFLISPVGRSEYERSET